MLLITGVHGRHSNFFFFVNCINKLYYTSSSWNLVHILERRYLCNLQEENFNHIIKDKYDTTFDEDLRYKGKSRYLRDRILVVLMR